MTTNVAELQRSVNGSSRRRNPRPPKDHVLDWEQIAPVLARTRDDFDERWADDEECEEQPTLTATERFHQEAAKRKAEAARKAKLGIVERDDDEVEDDAFVSDYDEQGEEAEVEAALAGVWRTQSEGSTTKGRTSQNGRPRTSGGKAQVQQPTSQNQEQHGFGTPSLRKRAEREGIVLFLRAFRRITNNGDEAILLSQLTYWFNHKKDTVEQRASFKRHGRIWEPKTHAEWAKETGMPEERIRRVIDGLVELGYVERKHAKYRGMKMTILRPLPGKIARACGYERKTRHQKR